MATLGRSPASMILLTSVLIIIFVFTALILDLCRRLKQQRLIIDDRNNQLKRLNDKLNNDLLINEEYIARFVNMIANHFIQLERLKRVVERRVVTKKFDDILLPFNEINIKEERRIFYQSFDLIFLKVFPNFIRDFNAVLRPEDQIWPKNVEDLNTELRIFALMRLGINDCETIAGILNYSSNTIYIYKMRIKSKQIAVADIFQPAIKSTPKPSAIHIGSLLYGKSA